MLEVVFGPWTPTGEERWIESYEEEIGGYLEWVAPHYESVKGEKVWVDGHREWRGGHKHCVEGHREVRYESIGRSNGRQWKFTAWYGEFKRNACHVSALVPGSLTRANEVESSPDSCDQVTS